MPSMGATVSRWVRRSCPCHIGAGTGGKPRSLAAGQWTLSTTLTSSCPDQPRPRNELPRIHSAAPLPALGRWRSLRSGSACLRVTRGAHRKRARYVTDRTVNQADSRSLRDKRTCLPAGARRRRLLWQTLTAARSGVGAIDHNEVARRGESDWL
jgi:hypothetical protein